jgi:isocitrate/isopropylmalate dehydrogenase
MSTHRIAVIAGDGIGKEVMPEGLRVLAAVADKFELDLQFTTIRLGQLRLLPAARRDDAGRLVRAT